MPSQTAFGVRHSAIFAMAAALAAPWNVLPADPVQPLRESIFHLASESADPSNQAANFRFLSETAKLLRGSLPLLIRRLTDASPAVRAMAADTLGELGPAAAPAVPALIAAFSDPEAGNEVKASVAAAIGRIGPLAAAAAPSLLKELSAPGVPRDSAPYRGNLEAAAIRALGEIGSSAAVPILLEMLYAKGGDSDRTRLHASYALAAICEPAIKPLIKSLPRDSSVHREAAQTLGRIGPLALTALREVLANGSPRAKQGAVAALKHARGYAQVPAAEIVPALTSALEDPQVRQDAAQALGFLGREAAAAVPALISLLESPDPDLRQAAAEALGALGPAAIDAVPSLIPLLKDPNSETRASAAAGLSIGPPAKKALPGLIELLEDANPKVRAAAAGSLSAMGSLAAPAIAKLIPLLGDDSREVSMAAGFALGGHDMAIPGIGPAAVPPLREALRSGSAGVQAGAAAALGRLDEMAEEAIPDLREALANPNPRVRELAAFALGRMGSAASEAVPDLVDLLEKDHPSRVRQQVAKALGEIGEPDSAPALAALTGELLAARADTSADQSSKRALLREALVALGNIRDEDTLPIFRRVLQNGEPDYIRMEAAKAWAAIDPESAAPAIKRLLEESAPRDYLGFTTLQLISLAPGDTDELVPVLRRFALEGSAAQRIEAAKALARFESEKKAAMGLLVAGLHAESSAVQNLAAEALGELGGQAAPVAGTLIPLLDSDDPAVRWRAVEALRKIGGASAIEPLLNAMRKRTLSEAVSAAWAALSLGADSEPAWEVLQNALESAEPGVRKIALDALADLRPPRAVPLLRTLVSDPHPRLAFQARRVLDHLSE